MGWVDFFFLRVRGLSFYPKGVYPLPLFTLSFLPFENGMVKRVKRVSSFFFRKGTKKRYGKEGKKGKKGYFFFLRVRG